ncbi:MAG: phosphotransferase [Micrococcales bacterium]|nr:phosphotransferase [Micrococcales bacterium]
MTTFEDLGEPIATGRSARIYDWPDDDLVVKIFEPDYDPAQVDVERDSLVEAGRLGVRVCACHGEVTVDGHPGLLLERVIGDSLTKQAERNPLRIRTGARALARTHVQVHAQPTEKFTDIRDAAVAALDTPPLAFLDDPQRALACELISPLPAGDRMLHLDFHTENVFAQGDDYVVIDWQTTLRGDPAADVAMTVLLIRDAELWPGTPLIKRLLVQRIRGIVLSTYLGEYLRLTGMTMEQVDAWRLPVVILRMSILDIASERPRFQREVLDLLAGAS